MSTIQITTETKWQTWAELVEDAAAVQRAEDMRSTGTPPERVGAAIVDEFAADLHRLADA